MSQSHIAAALRQRLGSAIQVGAIPYQRAFGRPAFEQALFATGIQEVTGDHVAALAFALAAVRLVRRGEGPLFFASLSTDSQERGRLHGHGLSHLGINAARVILLSAASEKTLLWAAEEAASCSALAAVVIALGPREKLYGFTASRRLKLRQQKSAVPIFIIRPNGGETTAATARWRIAPAPRVGITAPGTAVPLIGAPRFRLTLERYAGLPPQEWEMEYDTAHGLRVAAPLSHRPADAVPISRRQIA